MAEPKRSEEDKDSGGDLSAWFESLGEPENMPVKSAEGKVEGEVEHERLDEAMAEIPEVSTGGGEEFKLVGRLESREYADIYETERGDQPLYKVKIPNFSSEERKLMNSVREQAIDEIEVDPRDVDLESREEVFLEEVEKILNRQNLSGNIFGEKLDQMVEIVVRGMIGFGVLDLFLDDDKLEEIMVTANEKPVYVFDRDFGMCVTNISFEDEKELVHQIEKMGRQVGRRIDKQNPLLDAALPDGSRVNATISPVSLDGPTLTIRKFREDPLTIVDIMNFGTLPVDIAAFLWIAVDGMEAKPSNLLISGGTASGKSTTLNTLSAFIRQRERVISIEDTAELNLPHNHWVRLETRPPNVEGKGEITMEELVKNSLRMRPDRIIVGEVRGPEAMTMFTGLNTGHDGCMGTLHANSAKETVTRLTEPPMDVPEIMIPALDAVILQHRLQHHEKGMIRRITEIAELTGFEEGKPQLSRIFKWNAKKDKLESTGVPSTIKKNIADFAGVSGKEVMKEIGRRAAVLEWMRENSIRDVQKVGDVFERYYRNPGAFLEAIEEENA